MTWTALLLATLIGCDGGEPATVDAMTYNLLHGIFNEDAEAEPYDRLDERLAEVGAALEAEPVDILLLQEISPDFTDDYPNPIAHLAASLEIGTGRACTSVFGTINGAEPVIDGGSGLGQAIISCYPVTDSANRSITMVEAPALRAVLYAQIDTPIGLIDAYNPHISGPDDEADALIEIDDALAFIDETATGDVEIFAGDLNSGEGDPAHAALAAAGMVDLAGQAGLSCASAGDAGCTSGNIPLADPAKKADARIDYLYQRGGDPAAATDVRNRFDVAFTLDDGSALWGSDHIAVRATISGESP